VIVGIVGQLENVRWEFFSLFGRAAILGSIFVKDGVCVAGDILVWVDSDEC